MKTKLLITIISIFAATSFAFAEPEAIETTAAVEETTEDGPKVSLDLATDLVSAYVWRGGKCSGFAIQPTLGFSVAGFSLDAWGSTDFVYDGNGYSELDFTAAYSNWGVTLALTDYCWTNADGKFDYFGKYTDNHYLELGVGFDFGEYFSKVPISIGANVFLYGADKNADDKSAYTSYYTIEYYQPIKTYFDVYAGVGAALQFNGATTLAGRDGFSFTDVHLGAAKTFNIKNMININLDSRLIVNPTSKDVFFVASVGFSL